MSWACHLLWQGRLWRGNCEGNFRTFVLHMLYILTVVLEKALESPLDCKEIKPINPKGNQSWIFIGRTVAEAEAPILWPHDTNSQLIGKDPDAGKDWMQKETLLLFWQRMKGLDSITNLMDINLRRPGERVEDREAWCAAVHGVTESWTRLSDSTTTTNKKIRIQFREGEGIHHSRDSYRCQNFFPFFFLWVFHSSWLSFIICSVVLQNSMLSSPT